MSLDGLRAWIGEVERKLGVRTRVFLVLTTIAVGGAAAGIYLALDAQSNDVSKSDVEAVETRLLEQIDAAGSPQTSALETQVKELQEEVEALEAGENGEGAAKEGTTGATGATGGATGATGGASKKSSAESSKTLEKQLEEAAKDAKEPPAGGDNETKSGEGK
jgi:TolA-binding protein